MLAGVVFVAGHNDIDSVRAEDRLTFSSHGGVKRIVSFQLEAYFLHGHALGKWIVPLLAPVLQLLFKFRLELADSDTSLVESFAEELGSLPN